MVRTHEHETQEQDAPATRRYEALSGDRLASLYATQYTKLVRIAALLLGDAGAAEEVVQEAFVRVLGKRRQLVDDDRAAAYVTRAVVNLAHSRLRRRLVSKRRDPSLYADARDAAAGQRPADAVSITHSSIVGALRGLPARQRQAVVLRYYAQFTETEAAEAMGVSVGAVRSYTARGASALRETLKEVP